MKWFINLSTPTKLIFAFGVMWLLLAIVIITASRSIVGIAQSEKQIREVYSTIEAELLELRAFQNRNRGRILEMMMTADRAAQETIEAGIKEDAAQIDTITENVFALEPDAADRNQIAELKDTLSSYRQGREQLIALIYEGKVEEAKQLGLGAQDELFEKVRSLEADLGEKAGEDAHTQLASDQETAAWSVRLFFIVGAVAFLAAIAMVMLLHFTMARPLSAISNTAARIADGDLSVNVSPTERSDELGEMMQSFRQMVESLRRAMTDIAEGIALLGSSASEILASTTQVASGTAETATAISETTATVEEVRQAARLSSDKAKAVADSSQRVAQVSQSGQKAVEEAANGMLNIRNQMESIAQTIVRLSEQSQMIGGIIATVTDLADQSNLLAVNAAIEAARAGEQGKGFAVVAQEIKSLAEQSKQATTQIRGILNDVQKATNAAVMATEQGSKAVEAGVKQSAQAGESIRVLAESSGEAAQSSTQIVASSQQQVVGMDQIGLAMENINQAGAQTAASMRQAEVAAQNLHELGQKLKLLVEQYKV